MAAILWHGPDIAFPGCQWRTRERLTPWHRPSRPAAWSGFAVAAARAAYHLPSFHASMELLARSEEIDFESRRDDSRGTTPATSRIRYMPMDGIVKQAAPGTIEHFLMERYILY